MAPDRMQAMVLTGHGGMDKLAWRTDWPVPSPAEGQALMRVLACGLNNTDVNTRSGWYSKAVTSATESAGYSDVGEEDPSWGGAAISFPRIQGADICGEVIAGPAALLGKRVIADCWLRDWSDPMNRHKTGYVGSECDGGFAQYAVLDARNLRPIESGLSDAELATFSCSYTTAEGMLTRAAVGPGDTVLVTGGSGGVGSAAVQLAKRRGARVVALASVAKHAAVGALGADVVLPRDLPDLAGALQGALGRAVVDVVVDVVGGAGFAQVIDVLERGGRYATSGAIAGPMVELDLRTLYLRDLTFHGSTVVPPEIFHSLCDYIERGEIKPVLAKTYPLADLHKAQEDFVAKGHVGNIVVIP